MTRQQGSAMEIERLCRLAGVSRASYYRHWAASAPLREETELRDLIQRLSLAHSAWREPRIYSGARLDRTHPLCLSSPRERDDLKLAVDDVRDFAVKREMVALFGPGLSERLDGSVRGGDHQPFR